MPSTVDRVNFQKISLMEWGGEDIIITKLIEMEHYKKRYTGMYMIKQTFGQVDTGQYRTGQPVDGLFLIHI